MFKPQVTDVSITGREQESFCAKNLLALFHSIDNGHWDTEYYFSQKKSQIRASLNVNNMCPPHKRGPCIEL